MYYDTAIVDEVLDSYKITLQQNLIWINNFGSYKPSEAVGKLFDIFHK